MNIHFSKVEANGNNFIVVEANHLEKTINLNKLTIKMTNPFYGIGADGLLVIDDSYNYLHNMRIFNKDGSEANFCANGLRITAKYFFDKENTNNIKIKTRSGIYSCYKDGKNVICQLPGPFIKKEIRTQIANKKLTLFPVNVGNNHIYIVNNNPSKRLAYNDLVPKIEKQYDANIGVINIVNKNIFHLHTWEIGVGFTKSCGSNTVGAVALLASKNLIHKDKFINVYTPGGKINVKQCHNGFVYLYGDINNICTGDYIFRNT